MAESETNYYENVAEGAGKQNAEIAITNAMMIAGRMADECHTKQLYIIHYALRHLLSYLQAAQKHLTPTTTATN